MTIDVELALVLGLFGIGALVLAIDNLVHAIGRRITRRLRNRREPAGPAPRLRTVRKDDL